MAVSRAPLAFFWIRTTGNPGGSALATPAHGRQAGVIRHWWRGDPVETAHAVKLGCYFSINSAELRRPAVIGCVPWDRILPETDHPYGNHGGRPAPGQVDRVEHAIAEKMELRPHGFGEACGGTWLGLVGLTGTSALSVGGFAGCSASPLSPRYSSTTMTTIQRQGEEARDGNTRLAQQATSSPRLQLAVSANSDRLATCFS